MPYPQAAKQAAAYAYCLFNMVTFTIAAKATNTIKVTLQLKDARGQVLSRIAHLRMWLSDNADGSTLTATATTSALAVAAKGLLLFVDVTGKMASFVTDATGALDINLIQTDTTKSYYLCVQMPDGSVSISPVIAFT